MMCGAALPAGGDSFPPAGTGLALAELKAAIDADPKCTQAYYMRAKYYHERWQFDKAISEMYCPLEAAAETPGMACR